MFHEYEQDEVRDGQIILTRKDYIKGIEEYLDKHNKVILQKSAIGVWILSFEAAMRILNVSLFLSKIDSNLKENKRELFDLLERSDCVLTSYENIYKCFGENQMIYNQWTGFEVSPERPAKPVQKVHPKHPKIGPFISASPAAMRQMSPKSRMPAGLQPNSSPNPILRNAENTTARAPTRSSQPLIFV